MILWAVPGLPLAAALAGAVLGRLRWKRAASFAVVATAGAALLVLALLLIEPANSASRVRWVAAGGLQLEMALRLDPLTGTMAILVALIGLATLIYAVGYLSDQVEGKGRFFATLAFFLTAMLLVALSDSLLTLFVAWELIGLASFLLIGHARLDAEAQAAAFKAFLITRLADLPLLAAVLLLILATGTTDIEAALSWAARNQGEAGIIGALLLVGAAGKAAQLPFSTWLPDAMRAPTPVSALLHSATMVAAGAFLLIRFYPLLKSGGVLPAVTVLGLSTAIVAALAALAQSDLKRVLAYSTVAQLAEMITGVGLGVPVAALMLLFAHAGYKASLFFAAGQLQQVAGSTEMAAIRASDGVRLKVSHLAFVVSGLALIGVPVSIAPSPFDSILEAGRQQSALSALLLLVVAFLTGAYLARAYSMTYGVAGGPQPTVPGRLRLLGWSSLALAGGVVLFGFSISPALGNPLGHFLSRVGPLPNDSVGTSLMAVLVSLGGAVLGGLGARRAAARVPVWARRLAVGGFGLDAGAALVAVNARNSFAFMAGIDDRFFDPVGDRLAAGALRFFADEDRFDRSRVDAAFEGLANALRRLSVAGRRVQTGLVEHYLLAAGAWLVLVAVISLILVIDLTWLGGRH